MIESDPNKMISPALLVGLAFAAITYLVSYFRAELRKYKDINKLPGPPALKLVSEIVNSKSYYEKYSFISSLCKEYGPVVKLWIKPLQPAIMVTDVEFVDKILASKDHMEKSKMYNLLKPYMGEGVATTNIPDVWKRGRKVCNRAFQYNTVIGFLPTFTKYTDKFLESLKSHIGKPIDTQSLVHLYALDITFECVTKQTHNFQENNNSVYLNARIDYFRILAKRLYSKFLENDLLFKFSSSFKIMEQALFILKDFTYKTIRSKELEKENGKMENSKLYLIDILVANNFHGEILNDQINTFILAGHDTVAQAMCYSLYELSKHQEIQETLFKEVTLLVGDDPNSEINKNDLQDMKYLEAVVKEMLRVHAIVPIIERIISSDIEIGGIHYPRGTKFMFDIQGIHSSEKYFKNPDKFDPDRFMPENAHLIRKNTFIPFAAGPRDCVGRLFAMVAIKLFVAKVIQKFELIPVENHKLKEVSEIIIKCESGIPVIFKKRSTK